MVELCLCQTLMVYPTAAAIQCNTLAQSNHVLHAGTLQLGIHNGSSSNGETVYVIYNITLQVSVKSGKERLTSYFCAVVHIVNIFYRWA